MLESCVTWRAQEFDAEGSMQVLPDSDSDVSGGDMREEDEENDESEHVGRCVCVVCDV